jgi:hypothetical protein
MQLEKRETVNIIVTTETINKEKPYVKLDSESESNFSYSNSDSDSDSDSDLDSDSDSLSKSTSEYTSLSDSAHKSDNIVTEIEETYAEEHITFLIDKKHEEILENVYRFLTNELNMDRNHKIENQYNDNKAFVLWTCSHRVKEPFHIINDVLKDYYENNEKINVKFIVNDIHL